MIAAILPSAAGCACLLAAASLSFAQTAPDQLDLYLLIGQSNMAGRAPIEVEDQAPVDRVWLFNADGEWEAATNPLNRYSTVRKKLSMQRLSLGYTFARAMVEADPDAKIGLVMNARGGTRIEEWAPGEHLYNEAIARARAAAPSGTFRGILWHQGEGNSNDPDYLKKFAALIASIRGDLNTPELPVVAGQIFRPSLVNRLLAQVSETVPQSAAVSSKFLTTYDGTHFDSPSTRDLGRRYAAAMQGLTSREREVEHMPFDGGWSVLFDGQSFAGWEGDTQNFFRIADGAMVGGNLSNTIPHNAFLCTTREFTDFELQLEFKLVGDSTNSGVQFRSVRIPGHHEVRGYQADLGEPAWWGSLYDESRRNRVLAQSNMDEINPVLRRGDWNHYRIRCEGNRIQFWINGTQTINFTETDEGIEQTGIIGLQIHSGPPGEAWFRNIAIRELP